MRLNPMSSLGTEVRGFCRPPVHSSPSVLSFIDSEVETLGVRRVSKSQGSVIAHFGDDKKKLKQSDADHRSGLCKIINQARMLIDLFPM